VKKAQEWKLVKPQVWFHTKTARLGAGVMTSKKQYSGGIPIVAGGVSNAIEVTPDMLKNSNFEKLEHINVRVWIQHMKRGDVEVEVVSPSGIRSILAAKRSGDQATTGFPGWMFMTVKHWYVLLLSRITFN
jgi:kexin